MRPASVIAHSCAPSAAAGAEDKAFETVSELSVKALQLPARALADLAVQARAAIPLGWASGSYEADGGRDADEAMDRDALRQLIESCCAAAGVDWRGVPVGEAPVIEPVDAAPPVRQGSFGDLLAGIDLSAMSMRTLDTLHDHAETLNNLCYALASQPRSLNDDRRLNEAGVVLYRLAEHLLQETANACSLEAKRRRGGSDEDQEIRLAMVARGTIGNDDPDEILALARDLLAMVKV